jgi:hypothetical protein
MLWTQVITGLEVDDLTAVRVLRRRHLVQRRSWTPVNVDIRRSARRNVAIHANCDIFED